MATALSVLSTLNFRLDLIQRKKFTKNEYYEINYSNYRRKVESLFKELRNCEPNESYNEVKKIIERFLKLISFYKSVKTNSVIFSRDIPGVDSYLEKKEVKKEVFISDLLEELEFYTLEFEQFKTIIQLEINKIPENKEIAKITCTINASEFYMLFRLLEKKGVIEFKHYKEIIALINNSFVFPLTENAKKGSLYKVNNDKQYLNYWKEALPELIKTIPLLISEMEETPQKKRKNNLKRRLQ